MTLAIRLLIRLYWFLIPAHRRRRCIHRVSCSKHVYEIAKANGWRKAVSAFRYRFQTCRAGYEIIFLAEENSLHVKLKTGEILREHELSQDILGSPGTERMTGSE
jgi:uncharacterized protein